jgi:DNA-directed RNA polymerase specialized sigma24 family protein
MTISVGEPTGTVSTDPRTMRVDELLGACEHEARVFARGDRSSDGFALELLRRAVAERDPDAWEALVQQFGGIVRASIRRYRDFSATASDETVWVYRTFERFWMAVGAERLGQIPSVGALVAYLKTCAHSVVMDEVRERVDPRRLPLDLAPPLALEVPDATARVVDQLTAGELWDAVEAELSDRAEHEVAYQSLIRGAKPGEIYATHPDLFDDVADVYRIKRNLLERLRRSPRIRRFLA